MWSSRLFRLLILSLPATLALAGSGELAPADVLENVLDVVRADWNADGVLDRAVLWQPQAGADLANLYVFLSGAAGGKVVASGVAWSRLGSEEAWLEPDRRGFGVLSGGLSGKTRWQEGLMIAFENGVPRVVGYSYHSWDPAAPEQGFVCTADFAAGKGSRNGAAFAIAGGTIPLTGWGYERIPPPCRAR